jgi:hypothetical protein
MLCGLQTEEHIFWECKRYGEQRATVRDILSVYTSLLNGYKHHSFNSDHNTKQTYITNEKLHNLYSSPSIIRVIKSRKPKGRRPLGRSRRRWVDNIKMDLRQIGWDGVDWIHMA